MAGDNPSERGPRGGMKNMADKIISNATLRNVTLLLGTCAVLAGCIPPRAVVRIPQDYTPRTAQPQAPAQRPPEAAREIPPSPSGPLMSAPPAFTEKNVPADSGALWASPPSTVTPPPVKGPENPPEDPPQYLASMHLVTQAEASLNQGRPDAAIPLLEQAIQVDVYNGEAFFGLARAWQMKGVRQKAIEFARKAEILLQDDRTKLRRVYLFQADLYRETGDVRNADLYRKKADSIRRQ